VIDEYLGGEDWDEPPAEMALEMPYGDILDETVGLVSELRAGQSWLQPLGPLPPRFASTSAFPP